MYENHTKMCMIFIHCSHSSVFFFGPGGGNTVLSQQKHNHTHYDKTN